MKTQIYLFCLLSVFMFACSGSKTQLDKSGGTKAIDEQIELINKHITDPIKREKCLAIVSEFEKKLDAFHIEYREHANRIRTLQADYQSSEKQFQEAFDRFNPKYETMLVQLISARQKLVALTTVDEWQKIQARKKVYIPKTTK